MTAFSTILGFLAQWASVFWTTLREIGPFLVFGLFLAGLLHVVVSPRIILWALGQRGWRGALRGALVGLPLPLCSSQAFPTALALRRQGASLSTTTAFTISTPESSIDSLAMTAALLPSLYLGVRPLAAFVLAFVVGVIVEIFARTSRDDLRMNVMHLSRTMDTSESGGREADNGKAAEVCRSSGLFVQNENSQSVMQKLKAVFGYAFGTFFRHLATWLVIGLVVAAFLQITLPATAFSEGWVARHVWLQIVMALLIGIPLYSSAIATTPVVAVLLLKGLHPGAALAFLLAGPALNITNVFAFKREVGGRTTIVYYAALLVLCFTFGMAFHSAWPLIPFARDNSFAHVMPNWAEIAAAWILILLCVKTWLERLRIF